MHAQEQGMVDLTLQRRASEGGPLVWRERLPASAVALLLCDVWDDHWCRGAAARVDAMVPRLNAVVGAARARGIRVIHAPSDTMAFYAASPARARALALPLPPLPAERSLPESPLPIDDRDGGCDSGERPWHRAWSRQHPGIDIDEAHDLIADDGRVVYAALSAEQRTLLLLAGVHTNMCILNRTFGIKQMTRWGVRCALVRDLTDAMYNPAAAPFVDHEAGTQLVIEHIERHWCPSVVSGEVAPPA